MKENRNYLNSSIEEITQIENELNNKCNQVINQIEQRQNGFIPGMESLQNYLKSMNSRNNHNQHPISNHNFISTNNKLKDTMGKESLFDINSISNFKNSIKPKNYFDISEKKFSKKSQNYFSENLNKENHQFNNDFQTVQNYFKNNQMKNMTSSINQINSSFQPKKDLKVFSKTSSEKFYNINMNVNKDIDRLSQTNNLSKIKEKSFEEEKQFSEKKYTDRIETDHNLISLTPKKEFEVSPENFIKENKLEGYSTFGNNINNFKSVDEIQNGNDYKEKEQELEKEEEIILENESNSEIKTLIEEVLESPLSKDMGHKSFKKSKFQSSRKKESEFNDSDFDFESFDSHNQSNKHIAESILLNNRFEN